MVSFWVTYKKYHGENIFGKFGLKRKLHVDWVCLSGLHVCCICMYVCPCLVCVHVCVCLCMSGCCVSVCVHLWASLYMCMCTSECVCAWMYLCVWVCWSVCVSLCVRLLVSVCICVWECAFVEASRKQCVKIPNSFNCQTYKGTLL